MLFRSWVFADSEPAKAEACYNQVMLLAPKYVDAQYNLAILQLKLNKPDKAIANLVEILKVNPGFEPATKLLNLLNKSVAAGLSP